MSRLNKEINRMMSLMVRKAIIKAHPGYLMIPAGSVVIEDLKKQVGGVIQYRGSVVNPEANRPTWLTSPPGSPDSDVVINRFNAYMQDATSQHEATEGKHPGRVESGTGLSSLIRQDMIPNEASVRFTDMAIKRTFAIAIEIAKEKWKSPRIARVSVVPGLSVKMQMSVDPRNMPTMDDN